MLPSKWENLSRYSAKLIHACKKLPLGLDCRQSKYFRLILNIYIFPILGVFFLLHCTSICMISKSVSQIFKILFQAGYINIFVLCGVFLVDLFHWKAPFLTKRYRRWNLRHALVEKLSKFNVAKYMKGKFHCWQNFIVFLLERKTKLINRFLYKKLFLFSFLF